MTVTISRTYDGDAVPVTVTLLTLTLNGTPVTVSPALPQPFDHPDSDTFTYEFEGTAGATYAFTYELTFSGGATVPRADTIYADVSGDVEWYYGNQQSVEDFLGVENLRIQSNLEGTDTTTDSARVLRDGLESDSYFDNTLRGGEYKIPITVDGVALPDLADTHTTKLFFQALSNKDVAVRLFYHRAIQSGGSLQGDDLEKYMGAVRDEVSADLEKVKSGDYDLIADRNEESTSPNRRWVPTSVTLPCQRVC